MIDVETIKKALVELNVVLAMCIKDIALGGVYARTQSALANDIVSLISYLEKQLPVKQVVVKKKVASAAKKKGSVKGS